MWRSREEYLKWTSTLFFGTAIVFIGRMAMPTCEVTIAAEYGWDEEKLGRVLSAFFWGYATTQITGGALADHYGGIRTIGWSSAIWGALCISTPIVTGITSKIFGHEVAYIAFLMLRILLGIVQAMHYPALTSIFSKNVSANSRASAYSIVGSGSNLGILFSGYFGSIILEQHSWRMVFLLSGTCGIIFSIFLNRLRKKSESLQGYQQIPTLEPSSDHSVFTVARKSMRDAYTIWRALRAKRPFQAMIFAHMVNGYTSYALIFWLPKYFHDKFPPVVPQKYYTTIPLIGSIPGSIAYGMLSDKLVRDGKYSTSFIRRSILLCTSVTVVLLSFRLAKVEEDIYHALFTTVLLVFFLAGHQASVCVNPQDIAPDSSGIVFGIMNSTGALAASFGIWLCGWFLETYNNDWSIVFKSIYISNFLAGIVYFSFGSADRLV